LLATNAFPEKLQCMNYLSSFNFILTPANTASIKASLEFLFITPGSQAFIFLSITGWPASDAPLGLEN